jgi:hypothetical protein
MMGGWGAAGQGAATGAIGGSPYGNLIGGMAGGQQSGYLNNMYGQAQGLYGQQVNPMMGGIMSAYQQGLGQPSRIQEVLNNYNPNSNPWSQQEGYGSPWDPNSTKMSAGGLDYSRELGGKWNAINPPQAELQGAPSAVGPYGSLIGAAPGAVIGSEQDNSLQDMYGQAKDFYAQAQNPTQGLQDIYSQVAGSPLGQAAGPYGSLASGLVGAEQITPNTQLPYEQQMQEQGNNLYGRQNRFMGAGQGAMTGAQGGWGNIMKSLRGNRQGALMSQYGMPRRGGNAWGTAGAGAAKSMGPWEGYQQALAGQYYGGQ